jgi:membrane protein DedA with SNARE-associated domain
MSEWLGTWIPVIMTKMGYLGIGLLMFGENLFPPIPSELIMPLAGFAIAKGEMEFLPVITAGVVGTILGCLPWYYLGKLISEERLAHWADRYGGWLGLSGKDIDRSKDWFQRYGIAAVFFGRLVPGIRTLISLPAGIESMPLQTFLLFSTAGATIWVTALTALGYFLGDNYEEVDHYLAPVSKIVLVGILVALGIWIWKKMQAKRSNPAD